MTVDQKEQRLTDRDQMLKNQLKRDEVLPDDAQVLKARQALMRKVRHESAHASSQNITNALWHNTWSIFRVPAFAVAVVFVLCVGLFLITENSFMQPNAQEQSFVVAENDINLLVNSELSAEDLDTMLMLDTLMLSDLNDVFL